LPTVCEDDVADLCRDDPGRELTLVVEAALASGEVQVHGGQRYAERLWRWLGTSPVAQARMTSESLSFETPAVALHYAGPHRRPRPSS
jgi:hypothetical protein